LHMDSAYSAETFTVLFHVLCDGWNKTVSSPRNWNLFCCFTSVLFQLCARH